MTDPSRTQIGNLIADAVQAMETLNASRRESCAEHNERIRKLRDFLASLMAARAGAQNEMFDVSATVSPEIAQLLADPTHHL